MSNKKEFKKVGNKPLETPLETLGKISFIEFHKLALQEWLSTFNTESATACYTAVQRLKESVNDRLDEGNTR